MTYARGAIRNVLGVSALALAMIFGGTWFSTSDAEPSPVSRQSYKPAAETSCNPQEFRQRWTILAKHRAPRITHLATFNMKPRTRETVTRWAVPIRRLSVGATFKDGRSVSAARISKLVSRAGREMTLPLSGAGSRTTSKSIKFVRTVSNPTSTKKDFVSFRGWTKAWGTFRHTRCAQVYANGGAYSYYAVRIRAGKWRSYGILSEGTLRCGAGTKGIGATGRLALKLGCPS